jgi:hypothetical protein
MSEKTLRQAIIRLAHENPELREDLLPLVQKSAAVTVQPGMDLGESHTNAYVFIHDALGDQSGAGARRLGLQGHLSKTLLKLASAPNVFYDWDFIDMTFKSIKAIDADTIEIRALVRAKIDIHGTPYLGGELGRVPWNATITRRDFPEIFARLEADWAKGARLPPGL